MSPESRLYVAACIGLAIAMLLACLLAVSASGCSGVQTVEPVSPEPSPVQATTELELEATVDLGYATVQVQADATVAPPDEVTVCAAATVQALAVLRVTITLAWDLIPSPASWHLCVEALGLRRCLDG